jgi:iron complex outermembrane receptor protein
MIIVRALRAVPVLLAAFTFPAAAQTAELFVRVADPDRAAVVGAPVIVTPLAGGGTQTVDTRNDGTARFTNLPPGSYRVEIAATGFNLYSTTVRLETGELTVDAFLEVGSFRENVTVEGVATVPTIGRVNTPLRDQPLTVNTLTSEFIQARGLNDLVSALKYIPGAATYSQYGVYQYFTFRGFSDSVQLVDGIRNEGNRVNTQLQNVDRIEVLKGPSSVLYGSDALGAAVNIVLKKPSPDPAYEFSGAAGRWDTYRGGLGLTGRVGDVRNMLYRFDLGAESATNFRHDPWDRLNVTPSLAWRLSNAIQIDARYMLDRNRVSGDSGIPLVPLTGGFVPDPERTAIGDPISRAVSGDGSDVIPRVPRGRRYNTPQDFGLATDHNLRASYGQTFGGRFAFRNTAAYRRFDDEYWVTEFLDVTPPSRVNRGFLYFMHHRYPLTNQAELSGLVRLGIDHNMLAGWDYQYNPNFTHRRGLANFNTTPTDLYNPVETHVSVDVHSFPVTRIDYSTNHTNGVFFQDTMTVVPKLKVTAGGRFDRVERSLHNNPVVNGVETEVAPTPADSEKFTHRLGLVYQPTLRMDLYAQNSTSFKPNFTIAADGTALEPEYGKQFEVGQRLRLMQERLQLSTAVYHLERRNVTRNLGGGLYDQIGKQRARGLEAELAGFLTTAWRANVGYGFTKGTFLDYRTGGGAGVNLSGNTPRRAPEHTLTFSTSYAWRNGVSVSAGGQVVSEQFINDTNTIKFSPYEIIDLGVSYTAGRVQYLLNLTNLTDREYWTSSLGNRQLYPGQPFNIMAAVRVRTN